MATQMLGLSHGRSAGGRGGTLLVTGVMNLDSRGIAAFDLTKLRGKRCDAYDGRQEPGNPALPHRHWIHDTAFGAHNHLSVPNWRFFRSGRVKFAHRLPLTANGRPELTVFDALWMVPELRCVWSTPLTRIAASSAAFTCTGIPAQRSRASSKVWTVEGRMGATVHVNGDSLSDE